MCIVETAGQQRARKNADRSWNPQVAGVAWITLLAGQAWVPKVGKLRVCHRQIALELSYFVRGIEEVKRNASEVDPLAK